MLNYNTIAFLHQHQRSVLLSAVGWIASLPLTSQAMAQSNIVPDTTLGGEQSGVVSLDAAGLPIDIIDGGAIRGGNLFHSFAEFNISEGRGAYFRIPESTIENIISRITGANRSELLGTMGSFNATGVNAVPTLYFINPNGILFGPNSSLDLPASFLATTADAIELGANGQYSAALPESSSLLSINPSALLFSNTPPAPIINQAFLGLPAAGFLLNGPVSFPIETLPDGSIFPVPWGLQVVDGETIGLVGGEVQLGGTVTALGGRIEISSLQDGQINIETSPEGFFLNYLEENQFGDVMFSNGNINTSGPGGGSIQVQAARFFVGETNSFASISANTQGQQNGQDVIIRATESISINNAGILAAVSPGATGNGGSIFIDSPDVSIIGGNSSILTRNFGPGRGGDITVVTDQLRTQSGAAILTSTLGFGDGGNLTIIASSLVDLSGSTFFGGEDIAGGLSADIRGFGIGGLLTVKTNHLTLRDGANISARTDNGSGGSIIIEAEDIALLGGSLQTQTFGNGNAGNITIRTQRLYISEGNEITTSAGFRTQGNAGNIDVIASEFIEVNGTGGLITGVIGGSGNGGNLGIQTGNLILRGGGTVSAQAITLGRGGDITILADRVEVSGGDPGFTFFPSQITTTTSSPSQEATGNLTINTRELVVRDGGEISVDTLGGNSAGNLAIFANDFIELTGVGLGGLDGINPSQISASTSRFGGGSGGNINLSTHDFHIADGAELSVSSLGEGAAGSLRVDAGSLRLLDFAKIIGTSDSGNGGNLSLNLDGFLLMRNGSQISTSVGTSQTFGNGGNISINSPFIIAVREENSDITANAFLGRGGRIDILSRGIFGLEFSSELTPFSDITASSEFGASGVVNLNALDTGFIENGLTALSDSPIATESLIVGSCIARTTEGQGTFVSTGSGGLPTRPGDGVISSYPTSNVQSLPNPGPQAVWQPGDPIVEPTGTFTLPDGRLVLARECDSN